jgi:xylose isomerase
MEYFKGIEKNKFEGKGSRNPLAFICYNENKL